MDIKNIDGTNYKQVDLFFCNLQVPNYSFLNWNDWLYGNSYVISRKRTGLCSQHDSLFANRWLPPLNLPFNFFKRALLIWGNVFCRYNLIENLCHPNKFSFCLQGNHTLLIVDFNHCWKPTLRACCHSRLINCVVIYKCISGLPSFLWPRFPN